MGVSKDVWPADGRCRCGSCDRKWRKVAQAADCDRADRAIRHLSSDYRLELLGDVLGRARHVARAARAAHALRARSSRTTGAIWFRFWLPQYDQVVGTLLSARRRSRSERTSTCAGRCLCDEHGCVADDYILDIWIDPQGRVTVHNEDEFERAVLLGELARGTGAAGGGAPAGAHGCDRAATGSRRPSCGTGRST